jgi:hypothetical protein
MVSTINIVKQHWQIESRVNVHSGKDLNTILQQCD